VRLVTGVAARCPVVVQGSACGLASVTHRLPCEEEWTVLLVEMELKADLATSLTVQVTLFIGEKPLTLIINIV